MINTLEDIVMNYDADVNTVQDLVRAQPEPFRMGLKLGIKFLKDDYKWSTLTKVM